MRELAWLTTPYLSMLVICRSDRIARHVASHTALTLPVGWVAVLALCGTVLRLWSLPLPVVALCAVLSGLAMTTSGRGRNDGPDPDDDDEPPPGVDWDDFDRLREEWRRVPSGVR